MKQKKMQYQNNFEFIKKIIAYVFWTLSIWIISHYRLEKRPFDEYVQYALLFLCLSGIELYSYDNREFLAETIKSVLILWGTSILETYFYGSGLLMDVIEKLTVIFVLETIVITVMLVVIRGVKLHGLYSKNLINGCIIVGGVLIIIFKVNGLVAFIIVAVMYCWLGNKYHVKYCAEEKEQQENIRKEQEIAEEEKRKLKSLYEIEEKNKKLIKENSNLRNRVNSLQKKIERRK